MSDLENFGGEAKKKFFCSNRILTCYVLYTRIIKCQWFSQCKKKYIILNKFAYFRLSRFKITPTVISLTLSFQRTPSESRPGRFVLSKSEGRGSNLFECIMVETIRTHHGKSLYVLIGLKMMELAGLCPSLCTCMCLLRLSRDPLASHAAGTFGQKFSFAFDVSEQPAVYFRIGY